MKHLLALMALCVAFAAGAQSEFCGPGTIWDDEMQLCLSMSNGEPLDSNQDGYVGVADLLNLLSLFGEQDLDFDGIYDSLDECVGEFDECGVCNGEGPDVYVIDSIFIIYDSIFIENLGEWYFYELSQDTIGSFACAVPGCMDIDALNFNASANIPVADSCSYNPNYFCGFEDSLFYNGISYGLVSINNQCWFQSNLQTETYRNGDSIPGDLNELEWAATSNGAQAIHPDLNVSQHGRLYNWYAVDDARGLCPAGWHIPSDDEWKELELFIGMNQTETDDIGWRGINHGDDLKSNFNDSPSWDGNNQYGLSLTESYWRRANGVFYSNPVGTYQTSSSISSDCWFRSFQFGIGMIYRNRDTYYPSKGNGYSVRCMKD